ncbi:hypothetical protein Fcan01_26468 [Folsomia candida]|uniref:Uncharacterized protein n=1 Tax=Folsomia candida TaxID=158441 RepID=A0A226D3M9_FOLCA|nr:hypothetical protein Fcan01_26468 [Folsomia candida]
MEIYNLAHYISLFSGCVVNLINYENINIPSTIKIPIWITRFTTIPFCNNAESEYGAFFSLRYKFILLDSNQESIPKCVPVEKKSKTPHRKNSGHPRGWKCLTRFYIYPPKGKPAGVLPPNLYEERFILEEIYKTSGNYRTHYHILVQHVAADLKLWAAEMRKIMHGYSGINMLLLLTRNNLIENFMFCCRYCRGCFQISKVAEVYNKISGKTPWCILGYKNPLVHGNIHFSEISRGNIKRDSILLNLVLGGNASLSFYDVKCLPLREEMPSSFGENTIFLQDQCSSDVIIRPTIMTKYNVSVELVTNLYPYGFLRCSKARMPQTSLRNLVNVFPMNVWICVIATLILPGLFILLVSKEHWYNNLYLLLTGYYILLEQHSPNAVNSKRETHIYFVSATWILMSLVITNLIRGDNVHSTISPIRVQPYENFRQLIKNRFTFVDETTTIEMMGMKMYNSGFYAAEALALLTIETSSSVVSIQIRKDMRDLGVLKNYTGTKVDIWTKFPTQIMETSSTFSCAEEKIAYLCWLGKLQETKALLEKYRPGPEYSIGKEYVAVVPSGWVLRNVIDPQVLSRIKALHESGIAKK